MIGPGGNVGNPICHQVCLDMSKADHFADFLNHPYYPQDATLGARTLKLDCGESMSMLNVVCTATRSTVVAQYLKYCTYEPFNEPLSRSTLFRIFKVMHVSLAIPGVGPRAGVGTLTICTENVSNFPFPWG